MAAEGTFRKLTDLDPQERAELRDRVARLKREGAMGTVKAPGARIRPYIRLLRLQPKP